MLVLLCSVVRRSVPTSAVGFFYTCFAVSHLLSEFRLKNNHEKAFDFWVPVLIKVANTFKI